MRTFGWVIAFGATLASSTTSFAHPHVFIDGESVFVFNENGELSALRITWVYDEFTSLMAMEILGLDQDEDGEFTEEDEARVVEAQTIWPDDFEGDTYLEAGGKPVGLGRPRDGSAGMVDYRVSVSFELPLLEPLKIGSDVELRLYDPLYYYAYSTVSAEVEGDCSASIEKYAPTNALSALQAQLAELTQDETPEQDNVGRLFADVIKLKCD